MNWRLKSIAAAVLACLLINIANAQEEDKYVYLLGSYLEADDLPGLDDGNGGQVGAGAALGDFWNLEGFVQWTRADGALDYKHTSFGADLQFLLNRDGKFRPYLFAGAGLMDSDSNLGGDSVGSVVNAGAGFKANVFGSSRAALRAEYRWRDYEAFDTDFSDNLISLGVQIPFGAASRPPLDSDGDGVPDSRDRCPGTQAGTVVDDTGCEPDEDGDGVPDRRDRCPGTMSGVTVNADGCPQDDDGDGVHNGDDQCPGTSPGATVDSNGCELDDDGDGVVNRLDRCPETREGAQVDVNGCEIREEIRLPGVNFESNSDRLLPGANSILNQAAATLRMNPEIRVEVAGHTDSDGTAEYNLSLSSRRAEAVMNHLIAQGIGSDRLTSRGYGESEPIADNSTSAGKAENRRVVLRVIER